MKNKIVFLIIPITVTALVLFGYSTTLAQSPASGTPSANTAPIISDYAKDVQDGEKAIVNDINAQNNQKGAKDNENTSGKEEGGDTETQDVIEPKEAVEPREVENETESENSGDKSGPKSESESGSGPKQNNIDQQNSTNTSDKENNSGAGD